MGTTKKLPIQRDNTDLTQIFPIVPLEERIYISDSQIRHTLQKLLIQVLATWNSLMY